MLVKIAYQNLFLQPQMALNFLLDLEVAQLMTVAMMAQMMELMTVVMMRQHLFKLSITVHLQQ